MVNVQLTGAMMLPESSLAPDTFAVYDVENARGADGVNVAVRETAS